MNPQYQDKTGKTVDLTSYGDTGAQNLQANQLGLDVGPYKGTAQTLPDTGVYGGGVTQLNTAITPASLAPQVPFPVVQTNPIPDITVPPTPTVETPVQLSPTAQRIQDLQTQTEQANAALVGKAGYAATQQGLAGVPEQQKLIKDLTAQITGINATGQAIPLTAQEQATGRGITAGGLAPIQAAQTRQNAIQALTLHSQLAAVQGNLQNAMDLADRAVAAKYAPIEEQIKANMANLDLIIKSPQYTAEQKAQAQTQLDTQNAKIAQIAQKKTDTQDVNDLVMKVIGNNPKIDQLSISAISKAKTPVEAAQIASHLGFVTEKTTLPASAQEYEYATRHGYTGTYSQYQNEDANRKAQIQSAGSGLAGTPTSYKEWELAGKPGTYADYLKSSNVKAPTTAQQTVAEYAARIEQSNPIIEQQQNTIKNMNIASFTAQLALPSTFQSADIQQYMQAARNFINAKLRRESGAVISPTEFTEARQQYLPQPGDSEQVLVQKKANRDLVYASLKNAAGGAYQSVNELLGTQTQPPTGAVVTAPDGSKIVITD